MNTHVVKEMHVRDVIQQRSSFDLVHRDTLQRLTVLLPGYRAYSRYNKGVCNFILSNLVVGRFVWQRQKISS